jgi:hypothetical protein
MVQTASGGQVVQVITTTSGQMVHSGAGQVVQVTGGATSGGQLLVSSSGTFFF